MFVKAVYLGYHPLGGNLEIDGIKIMQLNWKELRRPIVFAFGKSIKGANPIFSYAFVAEENEKKVFFLAQECGIGKYHIWGFPTKTAEKLSNYKRIKSK